MEIMLGLFAFGIYPTQTMPELHTWADANDPCRKFTNQQINGGMPTLPEIQQLANSDLRPMLS